jgi:ribonuclease P protein component
MGERLIARARLSEAAAYQRALRGRSQVKGVWCRVFFAQNPEIALPRLGMVVPKKLLRTSVRRNAAKRQIRDSFRLHASALPHQDFVVQVIANDRDKTHVDWARLLRADIDALWQKTLAVSKAVRLRQTAPQV